MMSGVDVVVAWSLTAIVHGTVLLTTAWAIGALGRRLPDAVRESLWKVAVVGGVVTATLHVALAPPTARSLASLIPAATPSSAPLDDAGPLIPAERGLAPAPAPAGPGARDGWP